MASFTSCTGCSIADDFIDDEEEFSHMEETPSAASTEDSSKEEASNASVVLNTDYKKCTPLFRQIEKENWQGVLLFLTTGKWSNSLLSSNMQHMHAASADIQARTWVTQYDRQSNAEWSQLPLHAAVSYNAPLVVISKLIDLYPKAIQCTDNEGMLPIHLAFGFGAPDPVLALLLEPFPDSVTVPGLGGRLPHQCCELGPNKSRGKVFGLVTDLLGKQTKAQVDQEWRDFVDKSSKTLGLHKLPLQGNNKMTSNSTKQLHDVLYELLKDRKELQELKGGDSKLSPRSLAMKQYAPTPSGSVANNSNGGNSSKRGWKVGKRFNV